MAIDGDNGTSTVGGGNTGYNWSGYAEWLAKTKNSTKTCNLIVNYYANGYNGSAAENPPPSSVRSYTGQSVDVRLVVEVASGDTMSNPGYVFVGWATSNNTPTVTYNPGDTISNSWAADYRGNSVTNLYAVWTNQNVITYNPDDNSIEKSAIYQVKQSGQSATLKGATFTRTGYTQTGWATTAGGPKVYDLGGTYSSNNPLSLYPVWQANTYTITYVANEGTGTMADQTVTYDSTFTPSACSFTREGYSFSSWNESQDGKGIRWKVQEYTVDRAENITLYAIWKGNEYTVYYDDNYSRYSDEITGDIVTFESEYAQPLKKAEVSLSPIQSLNGYSSPWPGGGGKQLIPYPYKDTLPVTKTGVTFTDIGNGRIHAQGTATSIIYFTLFGSSSTPIPSWVKPNTTYTLRPQTASSKYFCQFILYGSPTYAATGSTFTTPNDLSEYTGFSLVIGIYNGAEVNDDISPMLEYGSTAHDWQPYSNICPISGRTGVDVYRTGKNLINAPDKTLTGNGYVFNLTGLSIPAGTYTLSWTQQGANTPSFAVAGENGDYFNGSVTSPYTLTVSGVITGIRLYGGPATYSNIQFEASSAKTTYEPYNGNTYAIDWTSGAGTVYGGTLDVVTGVLTDKIGNITIDDFTNFVNGSSSGGLHWVEATVSVNANAEAISSMLEWKATGTAWGSATECFATENGKVRVYTSASSLSDFKTRFADLTVVYELATPLTYQLTPTQVEALVGTNNVWSDGGPITIVYALDEVPQNMPPSTAIFGDIFYTRRNQLSRFGLTFKGWNTVPDGSGEAWLPSGVSMGTYKRTEDAVWNVSHNVTLYAQWDPNVYPFGTVFFNGRNAQDLGIIVEELPSYYYAERAFNHKQVNGKNGDVILDTGRYENVKKVYKVACYDPSRNFYESAVALSTFLHSAGSDYIRLEDSYEPSSYRMAIYEETNEIENLLGKAGRCEITFNCMPQRFLLSGDEEITIPSSGYSIYNPTAFDAKPMIRIQGTGTVTINGRSVQVTENDNDMLVDCENQNAKDLSGADMNYFIYCDEFPILKPGFNTISYTETIDAVKITPRWWIL